MSELSSQPQVSNSTPIAIKPAGPSPPPAGPGASRGGRRRRTREEANKAQSARPMDALDLQRVVGMVGIPQLLVTGIVHPNAILVHDCADVSLRSVDAFL